VREDPVLPDSARRALGVAMPLASDRSIAQLHSLHRIILGATERVVLSVARMDPERRYREPSGVMLEAAAAIGRPPLGMGGLSIPSSAIMHEQAFAPARRELSAVRARWPVHTKGQLDRAVRRRQVPKAWTADRILALDRLLAPASPEAGAMDGWFTGAFPPLPGLTSDRPLSASALARLLECPHRFLYERVLGWDAPPAIAKEGTIDALSYGSLFHATAEAFYREHGKSFSERARSIDEWRQIASTLAAAAFDRFVETYPLTGDGIRGAAKRRLQRDLGVLLERDWNETATFEDVERRFGPLALPVGTRVVHVHGVIDRIDRSGTVTLIRDLKTGRAKRRKDADDIRPAYDVQLGVYGLVAEANAVSWDLPPMIEGAYVYPADESGDERSFREDFSTLMTHTRSWLTTALDLLEGKRFPRTPNSDDCTYCPFKPVCGPAAQERAHGLLETPDASLTGFAALKLEDDDGEA
jgi:RecB family exonuclease